MGASYDQNIAITKNISEIKETEEELVNLESNPTLHNMTQDI